MPSLQHRKETSVIEGRPQGTLTTDEEVSPRHGSGEDTAAGTGAYRGLMGGLLFPAVIFIRSKWLVYSCVCVAFSSCAYIWPVRRGRLFLLWNGRAGAQLSGGGPADGARGRACD